MTITRAEYDAIIAKRTRPLTDPHMSNARATRERIEAQAITPTDDTADTIAAIITDRKQRQTNTRPIRA